MKAYSHLAGRDIEVPELPQRSRPKTPEQRLANIEHILSELLAARAKPVELSFDVEYGWDGKPKAVIAREKTPDAKPQTVTTAIGEDKR
jgi:hypothetical protein